jgi:hypothetical protein
MSSPLHAFMSNLCGDIPSIKIVTDNAVAPAHEDTWSQSRHDSRHARPSKPTRPNRIAAKGISYIASILPPELDPVLLKSPPNKLPAVVLPFGNESSPCRKKEASHEECQEEMEPSSKGSRRSSRTSLLAENQARQEEMASKKVAIAYAA